MWPGAEALVSHARSGGPQSPGAVPGGCRATHRRMQNVLGGLGFIPVRGAQVSLRGTSPPPNFAQSSSCPTLHVHCLAALPLPAETSGVLPSAPRPSLPTGSLALELPTEPTRSCSSSLRDRGVPASSWGAPGLAASLSRRALVPQGDLCMIDALPAPLTSFGA